MQKFDLIKFGKSEIKRNNIKQSYTCIIDFINENNNKFLSEEEIVNILRGKKFYKENKRQNNAKREISFINSSAFGSLKKEGKKFKIVKNEISVNWDVENNNKFWGLTSIDFSFFQFLLKSTFKINDTKRSSFFHLMKYLKKNGKIDKEIIVPQELKDDINSKIDLRDIENIKKMCFYKSGSSNKKINKLSNDLVNEFLNAWYDDGNFDKIHSIIEKMIENKQKKFSNGMNELLFGENSKIKSLHSYKKNMNKNPEKINLLIKKGIQDIKSRILLRIICGSWSDYRYLIKSHLNALDNIFIISINDEVLIREKYKELIYSIIEKGENNILKLKKNKFYSSKELLNFFNLKNSNDIFENKPKIIKEFYTVKKLISLFKNIKKSIENEKNNYSYNYLMVDKIIKNHQHIKGKVDFPTFYEFISGMAFLSKEFERNSSNFENEDSIIRKTFRAKLDTSLCPIRFAAGGRADIQIFKSDNKEFINIEPTTQLRDQTSMEFSSVRRHLNSDWKSNIEKKLDSAKAIIVATKKDENLDMDLSGWNEKNYPKLEIKAYDADTIIKMLESNDSIFEFIKKN